MDLGLLADGALALLLAVTIGYAVVLNRKLDALRATKNEMARMLADFAETTAQAEAGVKQLRDRAAASGDGLAAVVAEATGKLDKAKGLSEDLSFMIEKGESLADRLERGLEGGRALQAKPKAASRQRADGQDKTSAEAGRDDALLRSLAAVR